MTMAHHTTVIDRACVSCKATGLYIGLAERDGSAVVCATCKGAGVERVTVEWDDFTGRRPIPTVVRVYEVNPGIVVGAEIIGGMPARDWYAGKPFTAGMEMRRFTCPAWWYQSADYKKKPDWRECGFGSFSDCSSFPAKDKCWTRWDAEQATKR